MQYSTRHRKNIDTEKRGYVAGKGCRQVVEPGLVRMELELALGRVSGIRGHWYLEQASGSRAGPMPLHQASAADATEQSLIDRLTSRAASSSLSSPLLAVLFQRRAPGLPPDLPSDLPSGTSASGEGSPASTLSSSSSCSSSSAGSTCKQNVQLRNTIPGYGSAVSILQTARLCSEHHAECTIEQRYGSAMNILQAARLSDTMALQ